MNCYNFVLSLYKYWVAIYMNDLIYFSSRTLLQYDPTLKDNHWFNITRAMDWPAHIVSRVHKLDTPWSLAGTQYPIPQLQQVGFDFSELLDNVAAEFCTQQQLTDNEIYVSWSGGIDSTAVLVSLLKTASPQIKSRITVLLDYRSKQENAYFYNKFIKPNFQVVDVNTFVVSADNYQKIIILDGEGGNQIFGFKAISWWIYKKQWALLDTAWTKIDDLTAVIPGINQHGVDLIIESIKHSPVPIVTVFDFIWWANFNFKWDDAMLQKSLAYTKMLNPLQSKEFFENRVIRFFAHKDIQIWSMIYKDYRRSTSKIMNKQIVKKYIYDFDKNHLYYAHKQEQGSNADVYSKMAFSILNPIVAIDQNWNKYSLADKSTRQKIQLML